MPRLLGIPSLMLLSTLVVLSVSSSAHAFERVWHVGGGLGAADLSEPGVGWGPELGVHAAYGISDVFDLRLDAQYLWLPLVLPATETEPAIDEHRSYLGVDLALAYKIDILRYVPWFAFGVGYFGVLEGPLPDTEGEASRLNRHNLALSLMLGLDYALTERVGIGVMWRFGTTLSGVGSSGGLLRAEARFGP